MFFRDDFIVSVDKKEGKGPIYYATQRGINTSTFIDDTCEKISQLTGKPLKNEEADKYCELTDSGEEQKERACDSLRMCIVTTLNQGLRNGGGIGDILRAPSSEVCQHVFVILSPTSGRTVKFLSHRVLCAVGATDEQNHNRLYDLCDLW